MKKKLITISLILLLVILSFSAGFFAKKSKAVVGLPFGGHEVFWIPCTCSGALWIFYIPAMSAPGVPSTLFPGGPLAYVPYATVLYPFYNVVTPGVWHLGNYLPGVQSCWMYAGWGCFPLPVLGTETQIGTSGAPTPFN